MCYKLTLVITSTTDTLDSAGWQMCLSWKKSTRIDQADRDKVLALRDLLNSGQAPWDRINATSNHAMWQWEWPVYHSSEALEPLRRVGLEWPGSQLPDIGMASVTLNLGLD